MTCCDAVSDDAMKRTTISLPEDLLVRAKRIADQRGVSLGELVREATGVYVDGASAWDPPRSVGVGDSGGEGRGRELGELTDEGYGRGPR